MVMEKQRIKKRRVKPLVILLFICCLVMAFSCRHSEIYYRFDELKEIAWHRDTILTFVIDSTLFEVDALYDIDIELTHNTNYPYQNIWYNVSHNLANDSIFSNEQRQYYLSAEDGMWLGDGFGSLYHLSIPFKQQIIFSEKRDYVFHISQTMRDNPLSGIEKVGIRVSKSE